MATVATALVSAVVPIATELLYLALDNCPIAIALSPLAIVPFHREIEARPIE
jgi:hypothetical protein